MKINTSENPFFAAKARTVGAMLKHTTNRFVDLDTGEVYAVSDRRAVPKTHADGSLVAVRFEGPMVANCVGFDPNVAENDASVLAHRPGSVTEKGLEFLREVTRRPMLRPLTQHEEI